MSYHIYKTDALVIGGYGSRESSRLLYLLTRDFGLILVYVQSLRGVPSRLRYSLQDLSYASVDLVRGKSGWRLTSARGKESFAHVFTSPQTYRLAKSLARVTLLVRRLVKGEECNERLFTDITQAHRLVGNGSVAREYHDLFETLLVMKVLDALGYWGDDPRYRAFLTGQLDDPRLLEQLTPLKHDAIRTINTSLKETHL